MFGLLTTTITIALIVTLLAFNANQQATAATLTREQAQKSLDQIYGREHNYATPAPTYMTKELQKAAIHLLGTMSSVEQQLWLSKVKDTTDPFNFIQHVTEP